MTSSGNEWDATNLHSGDGVCRRWAQIAITSLRSLSAESLAEREWTRFHSALYWSKWRPTRCAQHSGTRLSVLDHMCCNSASSSSYSKSVIVYHPSILTLLLSTTVRYFTEAKNPLYTEAGSSTVSTVRWRSQFSDYFTHYQSLLGVFLKAWKT